MWWLNWRDPPPPPHTHTFFSSCLSALIYSFSGVLRPSFFRSLSPCLFLLFLALKIDSFVLLSCFPLLSYHNNSSLILSVHHLSLLHLNPLLLCLYISFPPPLPTVMLFFCCARRIHLACGRLGSDGCISLGGGMGGGRVLVNRYLLLATVGSVRADADFPLG